MKKLYINRKKNDIVNLGDDMKKRKMKKGPKIILLIMLLIILGIGILSILQKETPKKQVTQAETKETSKETKVEPKAKKTPAQRTMQSKNLFLE